ncbi:HRDC domain-containing protein [Corynebacterium sp. TAE3-ERU12]|uniref:HRDC domain-containing protein n=1 Tax=Corynebacterium sp. TAE3-ERU12 TaxID=2849491 RepID=UPI001C48210F|nr:HRDC domain-containing protein [Corynebacterium sp. TAE3-ERU12]MBV7295331.1 HRDC domain-containing protein [Corynebacterium sp. TAE3-ERU12]
MSETLLHPRGGTPPVLSTADEVGQAAAAIAQGSGPAAIDTERASAFVYDDRALLIQVRREGAGTFLIDPETNPGAVGPLVPVLNDIPWILHAAVSDLPCLAELGMSPPELFDTEIAGRLLGLPKVNLAALTEHFLGYGLAKGHGREDWSTRPLPDEWLDYAALDVELLGDLAIALSDALAEVDRLDWLIDETTALLAEHPPAKNPRIGGNADIRSGSPDPEGWRSLKGIGALRRSEQLVIAREMWLARDRKARAQDRSPSLILPHAVIIDVAKTVPHSVAEISAVRGFPRRRSGAAKYWQKIVDDALALPRSQWPKRERETKRGRPRHRDWSDRAPGPAEALAALEEAVQHISDEYGIEQAMLLRPKVLRDLAWQLGDGDGEGTQPCSVSEVRALLRERGARPWQEELIGDVAASAVLLPRSEPLS